ncbi:MAG: hypothetical protein ACREGR_01005 [Minisyncoccia bacterium]
MSTMEEHVAGRRFGYGPAPGDAKSGWLVPVESFLHIKKGRGIIFQPPIGTQVGEPNPFQRVAGAYGGQRGEVLDARVKGNTHYELLVQFGDGAQHWLWTSYLFMLPEQE